MMIDKTDHFHQFGREKKKKKTRLAIYKQLLSNCQNESE
jgi:hypothetical protein